jgi:hypothetical protein
MLSALSADFSNPANPHEVSTGTSLAQELRRSLDITANEAPLSDSLVELGPVRTRNRHTEGISIRGASPSGLSQEEGTPRLPVSQGIPPELGSVLAEIIFVLTCTAGQFISSLVVGHITVTQSVFREALGIVPSQTPWRSGPPGIGPLD